MGTSASHSPGQACLVLRWCGREIHFKRFFPFRDTNWYDAYSTSLFGSDSYRPAEDFLPDEFLHIGQVGVGFEFTPAGFVCWVNHRYVPSTGRW